MSPTSQHHRLGSPDLSCASRELARAQAARLDQLGIGVGDRVAYVSQNSGRLLTAFFGVCGSGRVIVPINFRLSAEEVRYIIEHSGARVLYVDPELKDHLVDVECEHKFIIGEDDSQMYLEGVEPTAWETDENATAAINYTSGTTARPKGVQITHRNIWTNAITMALALGLHRPRCLPAHAADVPLQRLGDALCDGWPRSQASRTPQS
ncbi:MAG: AMP-binding protein [Marmoricola sp.]